MNTTVIVERRQSTCVDGVFERYGIMLAASNAATDVAQYLAGQKIPVTPGLLLKPIVNPEVRRRHRISVIRYQYLLPRDAGNRPDPDQVISLLPDPSSQLFVDLSI